MSSINDMPMEAFACIPDTRIIVADFLARRMQRLETHIGNFEPDVEVYSWPQWDGEEKRNYYRGDGLNLDAVRGLCEWRREGVLPEKPDGAVF